MKGEVGDDTLDGGVGNDTITGGAGNDTLLGWTGSDTYVYNLGDGSDLLNEANSGSSGDAIQLGAGLTADNVQLSQSGNDLYITDGVTGDQIRIYRQYYSSGYQIETLVYGDGTSISLTGGLPIVGTSASETLNGGSGNDQIYGFGSVDTLNGNAGNDTLYGGAGNDRLEGGAGTDNLLGEDGDDPLVWDGADSLNGGAGRDTLLFTSNGTLLFYAARMSNLEAIDLGKNGDNNNAVTLNVSDVLSLASTSGGSGISGGGDDIDLFIFGDDEGEVRDDVNLNGGWTANGTVTSSAVTGSEATFNLYIASGIQVAVQQGLDQLVA